MTESTEAFRLSPQQHRLWRLDPEGQSGLLQARVVLEMEGPVLPDRLRAALEQLVARHEVLRTGFRAQPGFKVPFQVLPEDRSVEWHEGAAPGALTPEQVRAGGLHAYFEPEGAVSRLHLAVPSACLDAPGWTDLVNQLAALYAGAGTADGDADVAAEPLQYVDYAEWQLELLESDDPTAVAGREYWQAIDLPALASPRLPMEFDTPAIPEAARSSVDLDLDANLVSGVEGLAERLEIPALAIWLSVWRWLLGRHLRRTGDGAEPGLVVRFDGRGFDELEGALGAFARWLPLSADQGVLHDGGSALRAEDYLRRTATILQELDQNQPFFAWPEAHETLVPAFGFEQDAPPEVVPAGDVEFRLTERWVEGDRTRLTLSVFGRRLRLSYDQHAFDATDVERLAAEIVSLVSGLLAAPEQPMPRLPYLPARERARVVEAFNAQAAAGDAAGSWIPDRILDAAARHPDRVAVVFENTFLSYGALDHLSALLASRLRTLGADGCEDGSRGVSVDHTVALCLERSAQLLIALLGILRAGAAYAPLDPDQPQRRLTSMLDDLASDAGDARLAPVLITDRTTPEILQESARATLFLDDLAAAAVRGETPDPADVRCRVTLEPASLAYVIFTSGSTGRPKGVAVSHAALQHYLGGATSAMDLPAGATYATVSTFGADLGNTSIFPALCTGGTLHVLSRDRAADAAAFADYFQHYTVDCLKIVPSHLQALHESADGRRVLPHGRLVVGGEASERDWLQQLAASTPGCRVFNHYGPSEATVGSLVREVDPGTPLDRRCATVPIGHPLPGSRVFLLDAQGRPVPAWVPGEIHIGGSGLARGYLGRPALTAEVFVPDALSGASGGRLYRTGDLARHVGDPRGEGVEFLGRVDHQVKFHGFRIELDELRDVLNQHEGVRTSVVRLLQDQHGHDVLVAYYVSRHELESADLRATLAEEIPEETLPNVFVHLRKLPLNLNGKVNVEALPSLAEVRERMEKAFVPPRNESETQLAEIWKEVLGVPRVGINDNFFELGGHSLLATRVISRMRQRFSVEVPLRALFEVPSVAGLVEAMDAGRFNAVEKDELDDLQPGSSLELEDQLAELEAMSDEEAEAALERESILD